MMFGNFTVRGLALPVVVNFVTTESAATTEMLTPYRSVSSSSTASLLQSALRTLTPVPFKMPINPELRFRVSS